MKLYILRHGDAVAHGDPRYEEDERPLTRKGIQATKLLADRLRRMGISFDVILCSPLRRARQTAALVAEGLKKHAGDLRFTDALMPSGSMKNFIGQLNALNSKTKNVMVVGHEPYLSEFISLLCVGGPKLAVTLKKGALCRLDIRTPVSEGGAALQWLLQPRLLSFERRPRDKEN